MEYSVKITASNSFNDAMRTHPEMISGARNGIIFKPMPAPKIDFSKLAGDVSSTACRKKSGHKM